MDKRSALERALATQLNPMSRAWMQVADRMLSSLEVSNSAGWALIHLERLGSGSRQGDLAREIGITEASLVRTLQQLERAGLVSREADAGDRRANLLRLTSEGAHLARQIDSRLSELRAELLAGIPDEDLAVTIGVFERVSAVIAERRLRQ